MANFIVSDLLNILDNNQNSRSGNFSNQPSEKNHNIIIDIRFDYDAEV